MVGRVDRTQTTLWAVAVAVLEVPVLLEESAVGGQVVLVLTITTALFFNLAVVVAAVVILRPLLEQHPSVVVPGH
jgi:hypothetical protein